MAGSSRASRKINQLSARRAETVKTPGLHSDGGGLYLSVSPSGSRRWVFIFRWKEPGTSGAGKRCEMGLGSAIGVGLQKAREKAAEARDILADGKNPLLVKAAKAAVPTFGEVADDLIESKAGALADKSLARWKRAINTHAKALRPLRPDKVTTDDVMGVLTPIWDIKPETAKLTRAYIENVMDAAKARNLRSGENPARWRGHLDNLLPKPRTLVRGHFPAMPVPDVPVFMVRLRGETAFSARVLEFLILTAARTGQTLKARWKEIDFEKKIWTSPAQHMKNRREHRTPLTDRAIAILRMVRPESVEPDDYVFGGQKAGKGLSDMTMNNLLDRMVVSVTTHGFRSSFRDWAGDMTEYPEELAEQALAHTPGGPTVRAYRRGDALERRRAMMVDWATYCGSKVRRRSPDA